MSAIRNPPAPGASFWQAPGLKTANVRGQGIFKDAASDATIRSYFFNGTIRNWQVIVPDFGIVEGLFQITALEIAGRHDAEVTFELALESAGSYSSGGMISTFPSPCFKRLNPERSSVPVQTR